MSGIKTGLDPKQANGLYLGGLQVEREIFHRCLCCRDTGLVPGDVIHRYKLSTPHTWHGDYDDPADFQTRASKFYGAQVYICDRPGCKANTVEIQVLDEGRPYTKEVPRFADYAVNKLDRGVCGWIHEQEIERLKALQSQQFDVVQASKAIGRKMSGGKKCLT